MRMSPYGSKLSLVSMIFKREDGAPKMQETGMGWGFGRPSEKVGRIFVLIPASSLGTAPE